MTFSLGDWEDEERSSDGGKDVSVHGLPVHTPELAAAPADAAAKV